MSYLFLLEKNPFYLLNASVTDDLEVLTEKHEDALYDGLFDEQMISNAYRGLSASLPRLKAEVSWLQGMQASEARQLAQSVAKQTADLFAIELPALAKINAIASCFARSAQAVNDALLTDWLNAWEGIAANNVLLLINEQRKKSGFPQVTQEQIEAALAELRSAQVKVLIHDADSYELRRVWLLDELKRKEGEPLLSSSLLIELVKAGDAVSTSKQEGLKDELLADISHLWTTDVGLRDAATQGIIKQMQQWQEMRATKDQAQAARGLRTVEQSEAEFLNEFVSCIFASDPESKHINDDHLVENSTHVLALLSGVRDFICSDEKSKEVVQTNIILCKNSRDRRLCETLFPTLFDLIMQVVGSGNTFYEQVLVGYFSQELPQHAAVAQGADAEKPIANRLYEELLRCLKAHPDEASRETIFFVMAWLLVPPVDLNASTVAKACTKLAHELQGLMKQYPLNAENTQEFDEMVASSELILVQQFMAKYLGEENIEEVLNFIDFMENNPSPNQDLMAELQDIRKKLKQFQSEKTSHGIASFFQIILVIIAFVMMLVQCSR